MAGEDDDSYEILVEQRLGRQGFDVKLDRGFEEGVYCAYVEYDDLASRIGFGAARRLADEYCELLKTEVGRGSRHSVGEITDASRTHDPRRRRDLELTYLMFPIRTADGRLDDQAMTAEFRHALLRVGQQWDQVQAGAAAERRASRRDLLRRRLGELLDGDDYSGLDAAMRRRLLEDVTELVFPPRER